MAVPLKEPSCNTLSNSLLERVRNFDALAWRRLVERYSPLIVYWVRDAGLAEQDAVDIAQDVFVAILEGLPSFTRDSENGSFTGWVRVITRNKMVDFFRSRRLASRGLQGLHPNSGQMPSDPRFAALTTFDAQDTEADLARRAMELIREEFEVRTWNAFLAVVLEGKAGADVAQELGLTLGAVYTAKSRILKRLREAIAELNDGLDSLENWLESA